MNTNIQKVFLLTTLLVVLVGLGALSAADVSDNTTATQSIAQDTPSTSTQVASTVSDTTDNNKVAEDTKVATTSKTKSVAKENTQTSTKTAKTVKSNRQVPVNDTTFDTYFTKDGLTNIENGDEIIFEGNVTRDNVTYVVNQPVTINGNGYTLSLNTTSGSYFGNETGGAFIIDNGAAGSTLKNINFYNTQVFIRNTTNVNVDNINVTVNNQRIGQGVGVFSVRDNSSFVTVQNSNFTTINNSGSSSLVLAWANNCTLKNNTVTGIGTVGNLIYITTYNVNGQSSTNTTLNRGNRIIGNTVYGPSSSSGICMGITISGGDNFIEDNEIFYSGVGIATQWMSTSSINWSIGDFYDRYMGNTYKNNTLHNGSSFSASLNSTIENNTCSGSVTSGENSTLKNNNFTGSVNLQSGSNATNNILGTTTLRGNNILKNNTIYGNVVIRGSNILICGNDIYSIITVFSASYTNITIKDNIMDGEIVTNGNPNIVESNNTIRNSSNAKSLKSKSLKSDLNVISINTGNYLNYFEEDEGMLYIINGDYFPADSYITIHPLPLPIAQLGLRRNSVLRLVAIDTSNLMSLYLSGNDTIVNTTFTVTPTTALYVANPNCTYDGVTINANITTLPSRELDLLDIRNNANGFTMRNSKVNMNIISNTISWDKKETGPRIIPLRVKSNGALFENNNITINVTDYERNGGFDYPTCYGFYITGNNATLRNNNITIVADNMPGWLYSFEITSSNNLITNNNISVKGINYTAGVYFDSDVCQNNTVSNNVINLTSGNAGYGEGTTNENVGYIVTFTNRAYGGGLYVSTGSFKNNTAVNNTLIGNGYSIYGVEQFGGDNTTVVNNTIILNGTSVSAIAMIGINSTVTGNNITVNGKDNATYPSADYLRGKTAGIRFERGEGNTATNNVINCENSAGIQLSSDKNSNIINNIVNSLNNTYAVTVTDGSSNVTVTDNTLKAKELKGDEAVLNDGTDNIVRDNGPNAVATTLGIDNITSVKVGNNITVTGKLVDETNTTVTGAVITVVSGNTTVNATTDANGSYVASIPTSNVGTFTVTLTYNGNDDYLASNATANYTVNKLDTTVTIDPINGVLGKEVSFTAHVTDENNQTVTGGYIIFKVNGVTLKDANNTPIQVNVVNGTAVLTTTATWSTAKNTTVVYSGNDVYSDSRMDEGSISLAKQNATVNVSINDNLKPGDNLIVIVNITDDDNNTVNAGKVVFKLNGKTLENVNVTNGQVVLNYTIPENYSPKTYNITVIFAGSIYNRADVTNNFTLSALDANLALNVTSENLKPGSQLIAVTNITDVNGNPVNRGKVLFKLNGKTLKDENNQTIEYNVTNGQAILNYTIPNTFSAKTYNLTAVFGGSNYNTVRVTQNITLLKTDTRIDAANVTINGNTVAVKANIINNETNTTASERPIKVSVKLDQKTIIKQAIVNNGIIDLNTTLNYTPTGNHTVEIVSGENGLYNTSRLNVTVVAQPNALTTNNQTAVEA